MASVIQQIIQLTFFRRNAEILCTINYEDEAAMESIRTAFEAQHLEICKILNTFDISHITFIVNGLDGNSEKISQIVIAVRAYAKEFLGQIKKKKENRSQSALLRSSQRMQQKRVEIAEVEQMTGIAVSYFFQDSFTHLTVSKESPDQI